MSFINILLFVLSGICLFFAAFVYSQGKNNQTNHSFSMIFLGGFLWTFSIAMFRIQQEYNSLFLWAWFIYVSGTITAPSFVWFSLVFPSEEAKLTNLEKILIYSPLLFFPLLINTRYFIADIDVVSNRIILGPVYIIWSGIFFIYFLTAFFLLYRSYKRAVQVQKTQLKYILISLSLPGFFSSLFNIILPYFGIFKYIWVGPFFLISMFITIWYAVIKFRFMDLRIFSRDLLAKIIVVILLSSICEAAALLYGVIFNYPVHTEVIFPIVGAMTLTVFSFNYLTKKASLFSAKHIIKGSSDPEDILRKLTKTISATIGFQEMLESVGQILKSDLRLKFVEIILLIPDEASEDKKKFVIIPSDQNNIKYENLKNYLNYFKSNKDFLFRKESHDNKKFKIEIRSWMKENSVEAIFPLFIKNNLSGLFILGEKTNYDYFTLNEVKMLQNFSLQASFAIENARLFSEVQKFNQKLKTEIEKATGELRERNIFLATLRQLDLLIMESLDINTLSQKIVDTLSWELNFAFGIIGLVDAVKNRLYFKSVSIHSTLSGILNEEKIKVEDIFIPLDSGDNILIKTLNTKQETVTNSLPDVFSPEIVKEKTEKWQARINSKTFWVYPMLSKGKPVGILIFAWKKIEREITSRERDFMRNVTDQAAIAFDNTLLYEELRQNLEKLKRANLKLKELDKMKDEFVSIASHELRTPMTTINNYLWMVLNEKAGKISEKQKDYLDKVAVSTKRLIALVDDMLTVSKIEGGKLEVNLTAGDIVKLAKTVFDEFEVKGKEKGVKMFFENPETRWPLVLLDSEKIQEVLVNLFANAVKYTSKFGQITVSFEKENGYLKTKIADTGKGIGKDDLPKLFHKFGRIEHSFATVAETGGTGLGLYICKQIIDLHHGKIGAESILGKGSTFYFSLRIDTNTTNKKSE